MSRLKASLQSYCKKTEQGEKASMYFYRMLLELDTRFKLNMPETIIYGWDINEPTLFMTNEEGYFCLYPNLRSQDFCNFVINCSSLLNRIKESARTQLPLCVAKNDETHFIVRDIEDANNLWYKSLAKKKQILIHRYIHCSSGYTCTYRVYWSSMKIRAVRFTSNQPIVPKVERKNHLSELLDIGKNKSSQSLADSFRHPNNQRSKNSTPADRFLLNESEANTTEVHTIDQGLEEQAKNLHKIVQKAVCKTSNYEVSDFTADFIQGEDLRWYFTELKSYSTVRKRSHTMVTRQPIFRPDSSHKSQLPMTYPRPSTIQNRTRPHRNTKKLTNSCQVTIRPKTVPSQNITEIPFLSHTPSINISESNPTVQRQYSKYESNMNPINSSYQNSPMARLNHSSTSQSLLGSLLEIQKDYNIQYDTLKTATEKLLDYSKEERITKIRNILAIQNDSMSIRLHYEREFSKDKETLEMAQKSINNVVELYNKTAVRAGWFNELYSR